MSDVRRARVVVSGRVQGVGFRWAMLDRARSRDVAGWVRNRPDGSVEAVFEGPPDAVEALVAWTRRGPVGARVDDVTVELEAPVGESGFRTD
jgi:acylphosphatase